MSKKLNILVVEDSEDDAMIALRLLERGGFDVRHERVESADAMRAALARGGWDAVISDYRLPGFTGIDALEIFKACGRDLPFILVSGAIGEKRAVEAMKAGASDYVMKQDLARLAPALKRELQEAAMRAAKREAERALAESEHRLRVIVATEPECVKVVSAEGRLLDMNPAGLAMLEADSLAAVQDRPLLDFLRPEHRARFVALHQRVMSGGSGALEFEIEGLKGGRRWLETRAVPLPGANGEGTALLGITRDITERKHAERELQRFRVAMDVSEDAVILIDRNSMRYIDANRAMSEMTGYSRQEIIGMTPMDLFSADRPTLERDYDAIIADNNASATRMEGQYRHRDGRLVPIETRRRAFKGEDGWIVVGTARDITERKQADARIGRLNRLYAVLSGINSLVVRVADRDELFKGACRIAVEAGGFRLAWVGLVDEAEKRVVPVSWDGPGQAFVRKIDVELRDDAPSGRGLTARAVMERKLMVTQDMTLDPRVRLKEEAVALGLRALAVLPLVVEGRATGVLALYAGEIGFFDDEEMKLLEELACDIAFALDHIEKKERLDYLALYDQLTGLANRALFIERVNQSIRSAGQSGGKFALALLDIERLRTVNESLGRQTGDALLKQVAERLSALGGPSGAGRLSADQFALVLGQVRGRSQASRIVNAALQGCFSEPFKVGGNELRLAAKAGVALYPGDGSDADALLGNAEAALRKAKDLGERHLFYTTALSARTAGQLTLENQLRQALERDEFVLHYQPKVELETPRIVGVEALIRWQSPELGLVPPAKFIPLMEQTGLILPVGTWALKRAALDHRKWVESGFPAPRVAVNVSPVQLRQRDFVASLEQAILEGLAPTGIDLEITESLIMEDVQGSIEKLKAARGFGVGIAIDDFGTGYSSLGYLAKLPVHALKIDRSFIAGMLDDPAAMTLVSTIISLANSLKLKVVAEGVEEEGQAKFLRLLRCDQMQGYLVSKPLPFDEMTVLLRQVKPGDSVPQGG